ncbi:MAG: hypothetical protein KGY70_16965 [Bacteroidales bacterium]|nr:hypothetical protein [Bacteroidales bacterium]
MTQELRSELQSEAKHAADTAKSAWKAAMNSDHEKNKINYMREAEFFVKLSRAYSEVVKSDNKEESWTSHT